MLHEPRSIELERLTSAVLTQRPEALDIYGSPYAETGRSAATPMAPRAEIPSDEDFCDMLLAALVTIANKSKRRQADLTAALRRHQLKTVPEQLAYALRRLEEAGCIREIVPLYDGGTLVTVTNLGMDLLGRSSHWRFLQDLNLRID